MKDLVDDLEEDDEDFSDRWAVFSIYNAPGELEDRHNEVGPHPLNYACAHVILHYFGGFCR